MKKVSIYIIFFTLFFTTSYKEIYAGATYECQYSSGRPGYADYCGLKRGSNRCGQSDTDMTARCFGLLESDCNSGTRSCDTDNPVAGESPLGCGENSNALNTAIGCIDISNSTELIGFILKWA
ncbi:MAG: hypothetical protein AAB685_03125, partial [Patescibacteria group bacterium]